jgi:hypothetical protein
MAKSKSSMTKISYSSKSRKSDGVWRTILSWYSTQDAYVKTGVLSVFLIMLATPFVVSTILNSQFEAQSHEIAMLVITPSAQSFHAGDMITYEVHENSCNTPISQVRLNLSYATAELSLQKVDFSNSTFQNQDEYIAQSGLIQLGRSSNAPVIGDQYVMKAEFKATQDSNPNINALSINSGSSITDTTGTNNITTKTLIIGQEGAKEETQLPANCPEPVKQKTTIFGSIKHGLGFIISPVLHLFK